MTKRLILTLGLIAMLITACAPDPRRQANADATRMDAESRAADAEQVREQNAQEHEIEMQNREAAQPAWQRATDQVIRVGTFFAQILVAMWLLSLGAAGAWIMFGTSKAYCIWVETRANLIQLDPRTRQFPLLKYQHEGKYTLTNPNDNSVIFLDTSNPADAAKVKAAFNIQYAGTLAIHAKQSQHAGELAQISASQQIIDGE